MDAGGFTSADRELLRQKGISQDEALRQLRLLRDPPPPVRLARPCRLGDGIRSIEPSQHERLLREWQSAAAEQRVSKFVPASGAASRMFKNLLAALAETPPPLLDEWQRRAEGADAVARDVVRFVEELDRFPFASALRRELAAARGAESTAARGTLWRVALQAILEPDRLGYESTPKGLLPFHRSGEGIRTPFEEHLAEGARYARDDAGRSRLHFTISEEHRTRFERSLERARPGIERAHGVALEVGFSIQSPATDTLALDTEGEPARGQDGALVLRPGGHGALIDNLAALGGDIVVIKNIDNVVPEARSDVVVLWKKILIGMLVELQRAAFDWIERLDAPRADEAVVDAALRFARDEFAAELPPDAPGGAGDRRAFALSLLDRPFRVCGVVRNTGEPGGGPFWVRDENGGVLLQIVESSEVDLDERGQSDAWNSSTHFNPVDIVCGLEDRHGRPYELARYVDDNRVFISRKSSGGRDLFALERPGLWNGAMSRWNTVFVEVPGETFAPVKTVFDLLRPEHAG